MKNAAWVLEILQAVSNQTIQRAGLNQLIELTQSFAFSYLRHRYKNLGRVLLAEDITLDEMAVDAIAPLFERDDSGSLIKIKKAFKGWEPVIENGEQAVFFINRLVAKSVEKYVSRLLRESDPFFSKILRSLNYLVDRSSYKKQQIMGITYIVSEDEPDISRLPSSQFIYDLPARLFSNKSDILKEVFGYIRENTDSSEALPLNALVIKIKKEGGNDLILSGITELNSSFEIDSIVNRALKAAFDKLEKSYLDKNKIDNNESEALKRALKKIADDLKDGGINTGLHKYLLEEIPDLSFQDYQRKYQNIFEYLYKLLKKEIINRMKE